jgi:hypothetical protein
MHAIPIPSSNQTHAENQVHRALLQGNVEIGAAGVDTKPCYVKYVPSVRTISESGWHVQNTAWKTKTLLHGVEIPSAFLV